MKTVVTFFVFALFSCSASATKVSPLFAIHNYLMTGPKGVVQVVQIAIVESGIEACEAIVRGFRVGSEKSRSAAGVKIIQSQCTSQLPDSLQGVSEGVPLKDGYYITRNIKHSSGQNTFIDVMYGYEKIYSGDVCQELEKIYKKKFPTSRCIAPRIDHVEEYELIETTPATKECADKYPVHQARFDKEKLCKFTQTDCDKERLIYVSGIFVYCNLKEKERCYNERKWKTIEQYFQLDDSVRVLGSNQKYSVANGVTKKEFCVEYK